MVNDTIRILILHESRDTAEQILNRIRNSGRATRAELLENDECLKNALAKNSWDLMLLRPQTDNMLAGNCLHQVQKLQRDIPAILIIDEMDPEEIVEGLREGYQAVVPAGQEEWLLQVICNELDNLKERRKRRATELQLKEVEKRCTSLLDSSRDAITYVIDGMHTYANETYLELFGYQDVEDLEGMPILDMVAPKDHDDFKHFLRNYTDGDCDNNEFLCHGICTDGSEIQVRMLFSAATYDSEPCMQILIRTNQADAELQEKLKEISSQDLLTGLFNRQHFTQVLDETIEWAINESKVATLIYMQVDNFAAIQSDVGIGGADIVLSDIASMLRDQFKTQELARFSDDVFTILLKDSSLDKGVEIAEQLRAKVEDHLSEVNDRTAQATVSIGVTIVSEAASDPQVVVTRAHQASEMVREDNPLGNGVRSFDPSKIRSGDDTDTVALLQEAIDKGLFKVLFQPVIDLRGNSGELYEVLLRMVNENGESISPNEFLDTASRKELCEKVDRWVILQSIKMLSEHRARGNETRLMVNITADSLKDHTLLPWLSVALKAARMPGDALIFQFAENDATTYLKQAKEFTNGLHELHCQAAISRFGCSLNPFNNLKHLNVEYLKLDGSFIKELDSQENKENFKDIVETAHAQGKLTIAPFVESAGVLSSLWQIGVNYIQGYYLQEPAEDMDYDFSNED
ncbi:MAG: ferrous iron transporter C [Gammaproteobacteria bacterium]|nr:MAG: ferrous iron transporter C [Gammaproteobacteria bacterium]